MEEIKIKDANQNEIRISRILFGTSSNEFLTGKCSDEFLLECMNQGIFTFDTARLYGGGKAEQLLGSFLKRNNVPRDKVTVVTKICHPAFGFLRRINEKAALQETQQSLKALGLDYVDCLLLHRDDERKSPEEIIAFMNELVQKGYTRSIGVSNWKAERIEKANKYASEHHLVPFALGKAQFSLGRRICDPWNNGALTLTGNSKEQEFYRKSGLPVLCYSSLGDGMFSGFVTSDNLKTFLSKDAKKAYYDDTNLQILKKAEALAKQKNVTVAQVALAYCFHQGFNNGCILPLTSLVQAKEYLAATDLELTDMEMNELSLSL